MTLANTGVLSKCSHCNYTFTSRMFSIVDSINVSLEGNTETCPRCGSRANVLDGTFDFNAQGIAKLISGPAFTQDVYKQFVSLVERARNEELNKEEFVREAQAISPLLASSIRRYLPNDSASFIALLAFLWGIFTFYSDKKDDKQTTTIINNYNQNIHIEQPYTPYIPYYNRNYNVPGFYPTNHKVSQTAVESTDRNILVYEHKEKKAKVKRASKKSIAVEPTRIDTSSCDSTKSTIKRLLRKGK